jgi:nucleotide-binding universal stress UspA family protein
MININDILVATDFGPASDNALRYGRALAGQFGARLHVLYVTNSIYLSAATAYGYIGAVEAQAEIERTARAQTEALLTDKDRRDLRAIATIVTDNSPAMAVVEYARQNGIDLLVLGTHGRGAMSHLFMGSVAERVVRTAPCPVLTVHDPEHDFVVPEAALVAATAPNR